MYGILSCTVEYVLLKYSISECTVDQIAVRCEAHVLTGILVDKLSIDCYNIN